MPNLYTFDGYRIYFWANENDEPIHVHISKGKPSPRATKLWLTQDGGCIVASNGSRISKAKLNILIDLVAAQHEEICEEWKRFRDVTEIKFYC